MIRYYEDEENADHSVIHLMLNTDCDNHCILCCNDQYDLSSVPVVTVDELNNAKTVLLTGGEPFKIPYFADFVQNLRGQYKNIENLYVYTSGYSMYHNVEQWNKNEVYTDIDGVNISPKGTNRERWAIQGMLGKNEFDELGVRVVVKTNPNEERTEQTDSPASEDSVYEDISGLTVKEIWELYKGREIDLLAGKIFIAGYDEESSLVVVGTKLPQSISYDEMVESMASKDPNKWHVEKGYANYGALSTKYIHIYKNRHQ